MFNNKTYKYKENMIVKVCHLNNHYEFLLRKLESPDGYQREQATILVKGYGGKYKSRTKIFDEKVDEVVKKYIHIYGEES